MAGAVVALVGLVVASGWLLDIPLLSVGMKANTALGLLLAGVALFLEATTRGAAAGRIRLALSGVVAMLGLLTLGEYAFGWSLGIDGLLAREKTEALGAPILIRMPPTTAAAFLLVGVGLFAGEWKRAWGLSQASLIATAGLALVALCGYAYGVVSLQASAYLPMTLLAAGALVLLSGGALCAHPERGLMRLVSGEGTGSEVARRFLPAAILVPIALGWLRLLGEREGLYSSELGVALIAVATIFLLSATAVSTLGPINAAGAERKRAEERLRQAKDAAEAANKELEAFSYSVSHDLRAPLRGVDGFSQALLEDHAGQLDDDGKQLLARIRAGAQRMGLLIDDLLKLSGVTRSELRRAKVELSRLAREVADELQLREPDRRVEVTIAPGLTAEGDPHLLKVVLENLLGNAWKFSSPRPLARIEVGSAGPVDGRSTFFVRDNGAGFEMTYAHKLFGAFQRLHSAADFPGTGIGLATVQRVIHRHGGRVWAEGAVDHGATFFFTL